MILLCLSYVNYLWNGLERNDKDIRWCLIYWNNLSALIEIHRENALKNIIEIIMKSFVRAAILFTCATSILSGAATIMLRTLFEQQVELVYILRLISQRIAEGELRGERKIRVTLWGRNCLTLHSGPVQAIGYVQPWAHWPAYVGHLRETIIRRASSASFLTVFKSRHKELWTLTSLRWRRCGIVERGRVKCGIEGSIHSWKIQSWFITYLAFKFKNCHHWKFLIVIGVLFIGNGYQRQFHFEPSSCDSFWLLWLGINDSNHKS